MINAAGCFNYVSDGMDNTPHDDAEMAAMTLPRVGQCIVDDTHAVMDWAYYSALLTYDTSTPTGAFIGKRWKRVRGKREGEHGWLLEFTKHPDPKMVTIHRREILLIF